MGGCTVRLVLVAIGLVFVLASGATARTVDFATFPKGDAGPLVAFDHGVLVETTGNTIFVYGSAAQTSGACPRVPIRACRGDLTLIFFGPVTNLRFSFDPAVPRSAVTATLFNGERVIASGGVGGLNTALATGGAQVTRAQLSFAKVPSANTPNGAALRSVRYTTSAPTLSQVAAALPPPVTPKVAPRQTRRLDFRSAKPNRTFPTSVRIPGATVSLIDGSEIYLYGANQFGMPSTGGFCAIDGGFACLGDALIVFDRMIKDLSFQTFFYKPGDRALVRLFSGDKLLTQRFLAREGRFAFFGYEGITHIELLDRSRASTKGMAYGNFRYSLFTPPKPAPPPPPPPPPPEPPAVPLPASVLMLGSALALVAGTGALRRSKRKGSPE